MQYSSLPVNFTDNFLPALAACNISDVSAQVTCYMADTSAKISAKSVQIPSRLAQGHGLERVYCVTVFVPCTRTWLVAQNIRLSPINYTERVKTSVSYLGTSKFLNL